MIPSSQPRPRARPRPRVTVAPPQVIRLPYRDYAEWAAPARPAPHRASAGELARWGIAGIVTGNLIGFAVDPHGAWAAITGAVAQLLGR